MLVAYATYAVVAVTLVTALARTLYRNGAISLEDVFDQRAELADAVNRLLVTGFFMLNLGYASLILKMDARASASGKVEVLAQRLGLLLVSLAAIHFVNLWVFAMLRRRAQLRLHPPVAPSGWVAPAAGAAAWGQVR